MNPGTALVYHAGGLGDFVLSLPALHRLAAARPGAAWHFWGPRERLTLLPGWSPPPPELLRGEGALWGNGPAPAAAGWLMAAGPVVAFAATPPPWLPAAPRGCLVRSFPSAGEARRWVPQHQALQLDKAGVPRLGGPCLPGWRRQVLPRRPGGRLLFHPGSGDRAKNLPLATWRAAGEILAGEVGLEPLVLAGPVEQERGEDPTTWPWRRRACATLTELLDTLAGASLLLGNDSGATHLAAALGVPTVVVFGPSDPVRWRPLGPRVAVVRSRRGCAPCCGAPPVACDHRSCLDELSAATVVAAARGLLGSGRNAALQETRPARR